MYFVVSIEENGKARMQIVFLCVVWREESGLNCSQQSTICFIVSCFVTFVFVVCLLFVLEIETDEVTADYQPTRRGKLEVTLGRGEWATVEYFASGSTLFFFFVYFVMFASDFVSGIIVWKKEKYGLHFVKFCKQHDSFFFC